MSYHVVEDSAKVIPIWEDLFKNEVMAAILKPEINNTRWLGAAELPLQIPLERCDRSRTRRGR